jgi:hypothetical protein
MAQSSARVQSKKSTVPSAAHVSAIAKIRMIAFKGIPQLNAEGGLEHLHAHPPARSPAPLRFDLEQPALDQLLVLRRFERLPRLGLQHRDIASEFSCAWRGEVVLDWGLLHHPEGWRKRYHRCHLRARDRKPDTSFLVFSPPGPAFPSLNMRLR